MMYELSLQRHSVTIIITVYSFNLSTPLVGYASLYGFEDFN